MWKKENTCGSKNRIYSSVQGIVFSNRVVIRKDHGFLGKKNIHLVTTNNGSECHIQLRLLITQKEKYDYFIFHTCRDTSTCTLCEGFFRHQVVFNPTGSREVWNKPETSV